VVRVSEQTAQTAAAAVTVKDQDSAPGQRASVNRRPAGKAAAKKGTVKVPAQKKTTAKPAAKVAPVDPTQKRWPTSVAKSNYRSADLTGELVVAVRTELGDELAYWTNDEIVAAMGWALVAKGAIQKVRAAVAAGAVKRGKAA
jgi:hypothetical protein